MRMRLARYGHAPGVLIGAALMAAAVLTGCVGSRLSAQPGQGVRLQGIWKPNRAASQDPQKSIEALRTEAQKKIRRAMAAQPPPFDAGGGGGGGQRRRGGGSGSSSEPEDFGPQGPFGGDPLRNSP